MTTEEILKLTEKFDNQASIENKDGRGFSYSISNNSIRIFQGDDNPENRKYIDLSIEDYKWLQRMCINIANRLKISNE